MGKNSIGGFVGCNVIKSNDCSLIGKKRKGGKTEDEKTKSSINNHLSILLYFFLIGEPHYYHITRRRNCCSLVLFSKISTRDFLLYHFLAFLNRAHVASLKPIIHWTLGVFSQETCDGKFSLCTKDSTQRKVGTSPPNHDFLDMSIQWWALPLIRVEFSCFGK